MRADNLVVLGCRLDPMVTIDLRRPMALDAERWKRLGKLAGSSRTEA